MNIGLHSTEMKTWMGNLWKERLSQWQGKRQTDGAEEGIVFV